MSELKLATDRLIKALGSYRGRQLTELLYHLEQILPRKSVADSVIGWLRENVLKEASGIGDDTLMHIIRDILNMSNHPLTTKTDAEGTEEVPEEVTEKVEPMKIWYPS